MPQPALPGKLYFVRGKQQRTAGLTLVAPPNYPGLFKVVITYDGRNYETQPWPMPDKGNKSAAIRSAIASTWGPWHGAEIIIDFSANTN